MRRDDPRIAALGKFTPEGSLVRGHGDQYLFLVGRDDCHSILKTLLGTELLGFKFGMFGYDDDELNAAILALLGNPNIHVQGTLDKSQAGGVHERTILEANTAAGPEFGNSVAIGQSATHQITHTKGGLFIGQGIGFEGSMNWSGSGEGTGIDVTGAANPSGFKAQNNTLLVSTNPVFIARFGARLDIEHHTALTQMAAKK